MTTDPAQLLALAAQLNGLDGPDVKPWHVKATYETFDNEGKSKTTGTYEEWWVSAKEYKRSYVFPGFSQTDYITEKGLLRSGSPDWLEDAAMRIPLDLFWPMATSFQNYALDSHDQAHLRCVTLRQLVKDDPVFVSVKPGMYCLDADKPALRVKISSDSVYQALYNNLLLFQNHYVARNIQITRGNKPLLSIHVENIESLAAIQETDFIAPADAVRPQGRRIAPAYSGVLLRQDPPIYPVAARALDVHGTVMIQATIRKDGRLRDLHVVSGPPLLQQAALDAVDHWIYKPFLLNGQPTEIETQISVKF